MNGALIGLGNMGRNHLRVLREIWCKDRNGKLFLCDKKVQPPNIVNGEQYVDYKQIPLDNLKFVVIATTTESHFEIASYFLEKGIRIFIEKPVCSTLDEFEKLWSYEDNNFKQMIMVGMIERYNPVITELEQVIYDGELGDILNYNIKRVGYFPKDDSASIMLDLGIHDYDLAIKLFNSQELVYAYCNREETQSITILKSKDNRKTIGTIENSWLTPYKMREITVVGEYATAKVDLIEKSLRIISKQKTTDYIIEKKEPLKEELQDFINTILNDDAMFYCNMDSVDESFQLTNKIIMEARKNAR